MITKFNLYKESLEETSQFNKMKEEIGEKKFMINLLKALDVDSVKSLGSLLKSDFEEQEELYKKLSSLDKQILINTIIELVEEQTLDVNFILDNILKLTSTDNLKPVLNYLSRHFEIK